MIGHPLGVTLLGPVPGERWLSIERYVDAIAAASDGVTLDVEVPRPLAGAPVPRPFGGYRARYRDLPALVVEHVQSDRIVHVADQALGHLVDLFPGQPTVATCHDLMPLYVSGHYRSSFWGWFDRVLLRQSLDGLRQATRIIAVSRATAADITARLDIPPGRVSVVPNMVAPVFRPVEQPAQRLAAGGVALPPGPKLLSIGHTRPYKNIELLIEALAHPALAAVQLIRCGPPLTRAQRELAASHGVLDRITEYCERSSEDLAALYSACDVLVQPSKAEGFGLPVIEAMACGLPVVCSDAPALVEVANGAARVVPGAAHNEPGSASSFAEAVAAVLDTPSIGREMIERGNDRVRDFSPDSVIPKLTAAYRAAELEFNA